MRLSLSTDSIADYKRFLEIRQLPSYRIAGRDAEFPDEFAERIAGKRAKVRDTKFTPSPFLFDYQRDIAAMAIRKRKYAVFADCGLGKTLIMSEFARHCAGVLKRGQCVLIISPLMVIPQTVAEFARWYGDSLPVEQIPSSGLGEWLATGKGRIGITNYEALKSETPAGRLGALILDESSMLKSHYGHYGRECLRLGAGLDWKLALTGTPAPNDRIEYANHACFMDAFKTTNEFLARYFVNRGQTDSRWEIKPHALRPFYRDLSSWCIFLTNPAVYGWKDNCESIPPINVHIEHVELTDDQQAAVRKETGGLFVKNLGGITTRQKLSRIAKGKGGIATLKPEFIKALLEKEPMKNVIIWCLYNDEQNQIAGMFPSASNISGDTPYAERIIQLDWFCGRICECERNRRLKNTTGNTTEKTSTDGASRRERRETGTTPSGEPNMPPVTKKKPRPDKLQEDGSKTIPTSGSPSGSSHTESLPPNTESCSPPNPESVQSAEKEVQASPGRCDCTSTTATRLEKCAACSVQTAITDSENSPTIQNCSSAPQCTCGGVKPGRVMISKPRVLGFGLNLQCCTKMVFSGLQDSYESYYQAVKRANRYGSTEPLDVHIPVTEVEVPMVETVLRKAKRVAEDTAEQEALFKECRYE